MKQWRKVKNKRTNSQVDERLANPEVQNLAAQR